MNQAKDGAGIARTAAHTAGTCLVCNQPLGAEPWWVIPGRQPEGEHERCRDWAKYPFPFHRQLTEISKLATRLSGPPSLLAAHARSRLLAMATAWKQNAGAEVVSNGKALILRLKTELGAAGVEAKVIARL